MQRLKYLVLGALATWISIYFRNQHAGAAPLDNPKSCESRHLREVSSGSIDIHRIKNTKL